MGEVKQEILQNKSEDLFDETENLMDKGEKYFTIGYVGYACVCAIKAALYDINFNTVGIPEIENEDPDDWTACFYSSCSYSGGASWEESGNSFKRRKFWEWFLNEAVPLALNSYPETSN